MTLPGGGDLRPPAAALGPPHPPSCAPWVFPERQPCAGRGREMPVDKGHTRAHPPSRPSPEREQ